MRPLEELAESIERIRDLVAEISHDVDIGEAEIRDGKTAAQRRVDEYRAYVDGVWVIDVELPDDAA
jgi:hypothetical protein